MSASDVLGPAGDSPTITNGTQVYRLGWPTQAAKARLEQLVAAQAVSEVRSLKDALPPEDYAALWSETHGAIQAREHATGAKLWVKTMGTLRGSGVLFPLSLLREHHPTMTADEAEALVRAEPEQFEVALAIVVPPFFAILGRSMNLPEEQTKAWAAKVLSELSSGSKP